MKFKAYRDGSIILVDNNDTVHRVGNIALSAMYNEKENKLSQVRIGNIDTLVDNVPSFPINNPGNNDYMYHVIDMNIYHDNPLVKVGLANYIINDWKPSEDTAPDGINYDDPVANMIIDAIHNESILIIKLDVKSVVDRINNV